MNRQFFRPVAVLLLWIACILGSQSRALSEAQAQADPAVAKRQPTSADVTTVNSGQSLQAAMSHMRTNQVLIVNAGVYRGNVDVKLPPGAVVKAAPNARVVLEGLLRVRGNNWTMRYINVTWPRKGASRKQHLVKLIGGHDWRFSHAEVWGAHSYAAILVNDGASRWTLRKLYVHDTYRTNHDNQDHLVYVNTTGGHGLIERSLFANSPNGRGIKVGPPDGGHAEVGGVTIRYNTFYRNMGPSNIQLSYGASNNRIAHNLFVGSSSDNVTAYHLNGHNNLALANVGDARTVVEDGITAVRNRRSDIRFNWTGHGQSGFMPMRRSLRQVGAKAPLHGRTPRLVTGHWWK